LSLSGLSDADLFLESLGVICLESAQVAWGLGVALLIVGRLCVWNWQPWWRLVAWAIVQVQGTLEWISDGFSFSGFFSLKKRFFWGLGDPDSMTLLICGH